MNEAHQMYDDFLEMLTPLLPRTIYQDVRRVRTLAWAITGVCLRQTVRLGAWAQVTQSRAQYAASRVRRFARWLHHPAISPLQWYKPVLQAALVGWPLDQHLYVALDTTALTPFVLIRASLLYRGRAIPLAWRAMCHRSVQVSFEDYQPVLDQVRAIIPPGLVITLLADCGFVHEQLFHSLQKVQWHFRLRLKGNTLVHLPGQLVTAVKDLCPPAGEQRFFQKVSILGATVGPVSLALACLLEQPDDPWFVVSDEPATARTLDEYGLRFDIEESFLDEKSGGYQLHTSELATPQAAFAPDPDPGHCHPSPDQCGSRSRPGGKASLGRYPLGPWSELPQIGVALATAAISASVASFCPFWLDPEPDPLPALASRRGILREKKDVDLPTAHLVL